MCIIILSIWSWSLLQFTLVLTTKVKKKKQAKVSKHGCAHTCKNVCCSVDVWSILINIILQDAPFFIFRLLLILYYKIISYMNIFFTCKNTLVIILQFYRLIVVQAEKRKGLLRAKGELPSSKNSSQISVGRKKPSSNNDGDKKDRNSPYVKVAKKPGQRVVARLVRNGSEDDGTVYPSPAHSSSYLMNSESDNIWRHPSRVSSLMELDHYLFLKDHQIFILKNSQQTSKLIMQICREDGVHCQRVI